MVGFSVEAALLLSIFKSSLSFFIQPFELISNFCPIIISLQIRRFQNFPYHVSHNESVCREQIDESSLYIVSTSTVRRPLNAFQVLIGHTKCSLWIVLSSIVIIFNKWILDRFPFSITLTTWHMLFATIATQILARTTTLVDRSTEMTKRLYIRAILPIGMCFSMSLILSNLVYLYLSISFIQMLKVRTNPSKFLRG
jgi:hypothetical protein